MPKIHVRFQQVMPTGGLVCLCEHCHNRVVEGKVGMHVFVNDVSHILFEEGKECPNCKRLTRYFRFFADLTEAARVQKEIADRIEHEKTISFLKIIPGRYEVVGAARVQNGLN